MNRITFTMKNITSSLYILGTIFFWNQASKKGMSLLIFSEEIKQLLVLFSKTISLSDYFGTITVWGLNSLLKKIGFVLNRL